MKEKEKELERVEEQGCALVQNKTDEACAIVMETLQGVNHTWANLDHLVNISFHFLFLMPYFSYTSLILFAHPCSALRPSHYNLCNVTGDFLIHLQQIGQLKISLKSVLDQWSLYKRASEEINGYLMEGRYSVSRFRLLTGSLEAVQLQVQSLQVCWDEESCTIMLAKRPVV